MNSPHHILRPVTCVKTKDFLFAAPSSLPVVSLVPERCRPPHRSIPPLNITCNCDSRPSCIFPLGTNLLPNSSAPYVFRAPQMPSLESRQLLLAPLLICLANASPRTPARLGTHAAFVNPGLALGPRLQRSGGEGRCGILPATRTLSPWAPSGGASGLAGLLRRGEGGRGVALRLQEGGKEKDGEGEDKVHFLILERWRA